MSLNELKIGFLAMFLVDTSKNMILIKTLCWLTIAELMDSIPNCHFSALHGPNWPKCLPLKLQQSKSTTRKDNEMMIERGERKNL